MAHFDGTRQTAAPAIQSRALVLNMWFFRRKKKNQMTFEEILLDSSNLPAFNKGRMEGKMELPVMKRNVAIVGVLFTLIAAGFLYKMYDLQVVRGAEYFDISENNSIDQTVIIAERGVIYDRNGEMLAWNEPDKESLYGFPMRAYTDRHGLGQIIGYVSYPQKDAKGFYFRTDYLGINGAEATFNKELAGVNGHQLLETDAHGDVVGEHVVEPALPGKEISLSIDARLSEAMYDIIATSSLQAGFRSGAAVIMDVHTGEILAMTSYPSYDPEVMSDGEDAEQIAKYNNDDRFPFLNKVFAGVYTPGSIVKPFVAYAGLKERVISENTHIYSNGQLILPNPYTPSQPTRFADWRSQGDMTVREAIAFSSNVFFYIVGGGLPEIAVPQAGLNHSIGGLGITKLDEYFDFFGFGKLTNIKLANEQAGTVPSPEWKMDLFDEEWTLGNTYHTSIGQFGWQVTPLQMVVAYGALATGGRFFEPQIEKGLEPVYVDKELDPYVLNIVREGMHMTTYYAGGTARSLEKKYVNVAAKSGTAEIGAGNAYVNSWAAGYFPYEEPKYAFILMMDKAPRSNALGATRIMGDVMDWMHEHTPEYLGLEKDEEASE